MYRNNRYRTGATLRSDLRTTDHEHQCMGASLARLRAWQVRNTDEPVIIENDDPFEPDPSLYWYYGCWEDEDDWDGVHVVVNGSYRDQVVSDKTKVSLTECEAAWDAGDVDFFGVE